MNISKLSNNKVQDILDDLGMIDENGNCPYTAEEIFKAGIEWKIKNEFHDAQKDPPEIDREVIAILNNNKVVFAHRPPEYWDGKNINTGEITRYYPKKYDKAGWNQPDVKYWIDVELPEDIK